METYSIDDFKRFLLLAFNSFRDEMSNFPDCERLTLDEWWAQFHCFNYEG